MDSDRLDTNNIRITSNIILVNLMENISHYYRYNIINTLIIL